MNSTGKQTQDFVLASRVAQREMLHICALETYAVWHLLVWLRRLGIVELMFGAADRAGATLVLVTHNTQLADLCSRTVVIEDGHLRESTAP